LKWPWRIASRSSVRDVVMNAVCESDRSAGAGRTILWTRSG
jgi:hypothetical protein